MLLRRLSKHAIRQTWFAVGNSKVADSTTMEARRLIARACPPEGD